MAKDAKSSVAELLNQIGAALDEYYTGGALGEIEGSITDWNSNTAKNYGTPDEVRKADYLYDLISDGLAAAQASDEEELSRIATKLGKIDSEVVTSVPGLKQKIGQLRSRLETEYNAKNTQNILNQTKRQAAEDAARQYSNLSDRQRAMAADPKSKAAKQIADFNKKAQAAGLIDQPIKVGVEGGDETSYEDEETRRARQEHKTVDPLTMANIQMESLRRNPPIQKPMGLQTEPEKELSKDELRKIFNPEK